MAPSVIPHPCHSQYPPPIPIHYPPLHYSPSSIIFHPFAPSFLPVQCSIHTEQTQLPPLIFYPGNFPSTTSLPLTLLTLLFPPLTFTFLLTHLLLPTCYLPQLLLLAMTIMVSELTSILHALHTNYIMPPTSTYQFKPHCHCHDCSGSEYLSL